MRFWGRPRVTAREGPDCHQPPVVAAPFRRECHPGYLKGIASSACASSSCASSAGARQSAVCSTAGTRQYRAVFILAFPAEHYNPIFYGTLERVQSRHTNVERINEWFPANRREGNVKMSGYEGRIKGQLMQVTQQREKGKEKKTHCRL